MELRIPCPAYASPWRAPDTHDRRVSPGRPGPAGRARLGDRLVAAAAQALRWAILATGRGRGATLPGLLAERCAPGIAARAAARFDRVVLVSGTNGKTTTSAMLTAALSRAGRRVASNASGSNLHRGLATALLCADGTAQDAVLEVDEAVLPEAVDELEPEMLVLLNLTRDQLDRHHEVGRLATRWRAAAGRLAPDAVVVASVTDPRVAWVAEAARHAALVRLLGAPRGRDGATCPSCGAMLREARSGAYGCGRCSWSPLPATVKVRHDDGLASLDGFGRTWRARLPVPTDGYAQDAAAAWAAAVLLGAEPGGTLAAIAGLGAVEGRYARRRWHGLDVRLLLAKNPAGWDEAFAAATGSDRAAVIAVNAGTVDGRDTSWLWDVDMGRLRDRPLVTATGARAEDVALRLEVAGVRCRVERLLPRALARSGLPVDLFADYTAFQAARSLLGRG